MSESGNKAGREFAERLRAAMLRRGYASEGSRSGVDVTRLAEAAQTTYEMARRYAEGAAIPRPDKMEAIAAWLGLSPGELAWGDAGGQLNEGMLEKCLRAVTEAQGRTGKKLTTEQAAHAVATLYAEALAGRFPATESIDLMLRMAT